MSKSAPNCRNGRDWSNWNEWKHYEQQTGQTKAALPQEVGLHISQSTTLPYQPSVCLHVTLSSSPLSIYPPSSLKYECTTQFMQAALIRCNQLQIGYILHAAVANSIFTYNLWKSLHQKDGILSNYTPLCNRTGFFWTGFFFPVTNKQPQRTTLFPKIKSE